MLRFIGDYLPWLSAFAGLIAGHGLYHIFRGFRFYRTVRPEEQLSFAEQRFAIRFGVFILVLSLVLLGFLCSTAFFFKKSIGTVIILISLSVIVTLLVFGVNYVVFSYFAKKR